MKTIPDPRLADWRIRSGPLASPDDYGNTGAFLIPAGGTKLLSVVASDGAGSDVEWEHVSVSLQDRCPIWSEMCFIKDVFWNSDEVVMQLHPADRHWINVHPYCLHLWRPTSAIIPLPPLYAV